MRFEYIAMLYLGADHRGFELKEKIKKYLESIDTEVNDLGAYELTSDDDYNDYAMEVAKYVRLERDNLGILICGTGIGMDIVANKHKNVRAALCFNKEFVVLAREHESANILCLPADFITFEEAKEMVDIFLRTPFSMQEKHVKRITKISDMEKGGLV